MTRGVEQVAWHCSWGALCERPAAYAHQYPRDGAPGVRLYCRDHSRQDLARCRRTGVPVQQQPMEVS